jgi:hypothetical protein
MGACVAAWLSGQTACPSTSPTDCADLTHDASNFGGRGMACPLGQQCTGSACACPSATPNACGAGANAFCTNFATDAMNCGGCGKVCGGVGICCSGTCIDPQRRRTLPHGVGVRRSGNGVEAHGAVVIRPMDLRHAPRALS